MNTDAMNTDNEAARIAIQELKNIAQARRYDAEYFSSDGDFARWAQNRARFSLAQAEDALRHEQAEVARLRALCGVLKPICVASGLGPDIEWVLEAASRGLYDGDPKDAFLNYSLVMQCADEQLLTLLSDLQDELEEELAVTRASLSRDGLPGSARTIPRITRLEDLLTRVRGRMSSLQD